jgi:uncharacterized protein (TIGR01244 family)
MPPITLRSMIAVALLIGACGTTSSQSPIASAASAPSGQVSADAAAQGQAAPAPLLAIPNAAQAASGLLTGGQPSPEQLQEAARLGYHTVISLRADGEPGSAGEREQVEALGMHFVSIPVAGPADLTESNARALDAALASASAQPTILHCGGGDRAGALLALRAFYTQGKSADEALELGTKAGLKKLSTAVSEQLRAAEAARSAAAAP